jgi:phosphate:Na+ symporter
MIELLALYLAGLSFFFTGVAGISDNVRQLSGQRFRQLLSKATHHPIMASGLGVVMGAVTQSTSVVAFILSGMTATGLLPMSRALLVLAFSNLGTALLVFIAALDLHIAIMFLIGASGLILAFRLFVKLKPAFAGLLSIGLVFFGLDMAKQAFHPMTTSTGLTQVGKLFEYWPDAAFFLGMAMRVVVHSSSAAAAITITMNKGGFLGEFPAMMSIAGLGIGTAAATYLLSSNLRGVPRQIALYQALGNVAACVVMTTLLLFERLTGEPVLLALAYRLSGTVSGRMAFMYFFLNILIVIVSLIGVPWAPAWLERLCPPTPEQDLSRPMFVQVEALRSPETALDLVAMEQMRLMRAMQRYLVAARGHVEIELVPLHEAARALGAEISDFIDALVRQPISTSLAARVISFQRKEDTLHSLEENIFLFADTLQDKAHGSPMGSRLIEALDTIVLTAMDALTGNDPFDEQLLMQLTDDRGSMMERLRNQLKVGGVEAVENVAALHYATTLFERNVWLMRQLALWIREDARLSAV